MKEILYESGHLPVARSSSLPSDHDCSRGGFLPSTKILRQFFQNCFKASSRVFTSYVFLFILIKIMNNWSDDEPPARLKSSLMWSQKGAVWQVKAGLQST